MNAANQPQRRFQSPEELFDHTRHVDSTPATPKYRALLSELMEESGRDAAQETQSKRARLADNREQAVRQRIEAGERRREVAREALRREQRRQRRAAHMRTRELAAIEDELNPRPAQVLRTSSEVYAVATAHVEMGEAQPARRSRRPHMLGLLCAVLVATLLVPAAVSGSATTNNGPDLQKAGVALSKPVASDVVMMDMVMVTDQSPSDTADSDDEPRSSTQRRERRRSRSADRTSAQAEAAVEAQAEPQPRPALNISLDDNNVFSRGSD